MLADLLVSVTRVLSEVALLTEIHCDAKFGNRIAWRKSLPDALEYARREFRPIMVIVWMDGCPSCTEFIPKLANSDEIVNLAAQEFSVVALNEHRDDVKNFRVDGGYTPRIYFMSPTGEVDLRFYNKTDADPDYKFYYPTVDGVVKTMKSVVKTYPDRCMPSRPCRIHVKT